MIRINLLGQIRPKAARRPVDTGSALPAVFIFAGFVLGVVVLGLLYLSWQRQLNAENQEIQKLQVEKRDLLTIQQQVQAFQTQKDALQIRVNTIEQLQRDRTGAQELLDEIASTVSRTENLWLTNMTRKGSTIALEGSSGSINSIANFITALKRSGYFNDVEIKESKQDDKNTTVQTFTFQISAQIASQAGALPPQTGAPAQPAGKAGSAHPMVMNDSTTPDRKG